MHATTAIKIGGHKSERTHGYPANTVITLDAVASGAETASACLSSSRP